MMDDHGRRSVVVKVLMGALRLLSHSSHLHVPQDSLELADGSADGVALEPVGD